MPSSTPTFTRRTALSTAAAAAASLALPVEAAVTLPEADAGTPTAALRGISAATLEAAEKVALVTDTPQERALVLKALGPHLEGVRARRKLTLPNSLAPAEVFDPLMPGTPLPRATRLVRSKAGAAPPPTDDEALAFCSLSQLSRWLEHRQLTSERLTRVYLERLERIGPRLFCAPTVTRELALKQAKAADAELRAGHYRGPLHGIPFGLKDLFDTAGIRTAWGAEPYVDRVPKTDATVVTRLYAAGAVLVAKLSLGALAMDDIWYGGKTRNPWYLDEGSNGSSAGSCAATAAGLVGFALGSETLGSVISPSMRCGTTGLRPTFGRVPRSGAMALCWSLDKVGVICRTVEDTALVLAAIHGADPLDPSSRSVPLEFDALAKVKGVRVGYVPSSFKGPATVDADRAALESLKQLGVSLVEVALPELPYNSLLPILFAESAAAFEDLTLSNADDLLSQQTQDSWPNVFRTSRFITAIDYLQAQRVRRLAMEQFAALFGKVEMLVSPSLAAPFMLATNFTGHPSLTLRTGYREISQPRGEDDLGSEASTSALTAKVRVPHGVTLWGRLFDEGRLCQVGRAWEAALGVWSGRPPV